jgi:glycerol kinase
LQKDGKFRNIFFKSSSIFYSLFIRCEQDPFEILESVKVSLDGAIKGLEEKNYSREQIAAVGITNQRETTIVWDKITGIKYI